MEGTGVPQFLRRKALDSDDTDDEAPLSSGKHSRVSDDADSAMFEAKPGEDDFATTMMTPASLRRQLRMLSTPPQYAKPQRSVSMAPRPSPLSPARRVVPREPSVDRLRSPAGPRGFPGGNHPDELLARLQQRMAELRSPGSRDRVHFTFDTSLKRL